MRSGRYSAVDDRIRAARSEQNRLNDLGREILEQIAEAQDVIDYATILPGSHTAEEVAEAEELVRAGEIISRKLRIAHSAAGTEVRRATDERIKLERQAMRRQVVLPKLGFFERKRLARAVRSLNARSDTEAQ